MTKTNSGTSLARRNLLLWMVLIFCPAASFAQAGQITATVNTPRQFQFGARFTF
jgi:hypothetical protein